MIPESVPRPDLQSCAVFQHDGAANGPDCFYKLIPEKGCDIAKGIVEGQKFNRPQAPNGKGGSMDYADLANYQAIVRQPVQGTYRGYLIKAVAPPSSGGLTVLQMLKMLERFPIAMRRRVTASARSRPPM